MDAFLPEFHTQFFFLFLFAFPHDKFVSLFFFPKYPLLPMSSLPLAWTRPRP